MKLYVLEKNHSTFTGKTAGNLIYSINMFIRVFSIDECFLKHLSLSLFKDQIPKTIFLLHQFAPIKAIFMPDFKKNGAYHSIY